MRIIAGVMGLMLFVLAAASEAAGYSEGKDYVVLAQPVHPADETKIEVNEVFSYACPHCFHFEPLLKAWSKTQAADVVLVQTHAGFSNPHWLPYQRGYYTVIALGVKDKVSEAIFNSVHVANKEIESAQDWADFLSQYGVDKQKTISTFNSFGVSSQIKQADTRVKNFQVTSTPQLIVDGRFRITATNHEDMLKVAQFLVEKVRAERKH